ncbi:hypothetical protein BV898_02409 [Hypsibius exemplaris]|uniref:Uncharacterized protein n=1 Tax=Hypsibius exemplaris TaxID=2072580 RepID=A0A1W0X819_HYPEX|nr:hypothetical protein BV898_02409 [Hypsibius exemplaris]
MFLNLVILSTILVPICLVPLEAQQSPLQVELISIGPVSPLSTTSLVYIAPAMETTVEELNNGPYTGHVKFSLKFLYNRSLSNGNDVQYYSDQMMANWYYMDRSKTANVSIIILPGGPEDIYINRLAANWNVLLLTW